MVKKPDGERPPDFRKTFHKKRVFITGHTGFKGSWLSVWMHVLGAEVKGYALKPELISLYNHVQNKLKNHQSVIADIRNSKKLESEIQSFQPDFIFHLAAQPLVLESYKNPLETFETNAIGTAHLLEAVRTLKKKCMVVIITTDKVYKNRETDYAYTESDSLGGYDPYSASKAAAEIITESYRLSYFNPADYKKHKKSVATARSGNVIGGGDYAKDRIVPDIFRALSVSKAIEIRNPKAVRPWQHVLESLHGYLTLAACMNKEPEKFAESFNFGPARNDTCTVEELVVKAIKSWGAGSYKVLKQKKVMHEAGLLKLNINKAWNKIGWKPAWSSDQSIDRTLLWYKKSTEKKADVMGLCMEDIEKYILKKNI